MWSLEIRDNEARLYINMSWLKSGSSCPKVGSD